MYLAYCCFLMDEQFYYDSEMGGAAFSESCTGKVACGVFYARKTRSAIPILPYEKARVTILYNFC